MTRLLEKLVATEATLLTERMEGCKPVQLPQGWAILWKDQLVAFDWHSGLALQVHQRLGKQVPLFTAAEQAAALAVAFQTGNTHTRLLPAEYPFNYRLYGLISPDHFRPTDKLAVRDAFHRALTEAGVPTGHPRFDLTHYGAPIEEFALPPAGSNLQANVRLIYGLDNGSSAYKLDLGHVTVYICKNGLFFEQNNTEQRLAWTHSDGQSVEAFLFAAVPTVIAWLAQYEQGIEQAKDAPVIRTALEIGLELLKPFGDGAKRVVGSMLKRQQASEINTWGNTNWAHSQALSYVGTHNATGALGFQMRREAARLLAT